jgi:hypothetical protein
VRNEFGRAGVSTNMDHLNFSISPRMIRPLAIVLLAASVLWGIVTWSPDKGLDLYRSGSFFIGESVTNWVMNRFEAALKAANIPVPDQE